MNLGALLKTAKPVDIPVRFVYSGIVRVYFSRNPIDRYTHIFQTLPDFNEKDFTAENIIKSVRDTTLGKVLVESKCFSIVDLSFITNFKTKQHYNWFKYDTIFSSIKTKIKFQFRLELCKTPHPNEEIALDRSQGTSHIFYSHHTEISNELLRKYQLKVQSKWNELL